MDKDGVRLEGVRREYDWGETTPTYAILETISVFEYGHPDRTEAVLDTPLYEYVDPDGLEKAVNSSATVTIEFIVSKYEIQIAGNQVSVTSADTI